MKFHRMIVNLKIQTNLDQMNGRNIWKHGRMTTAIVMSAIIGRDQMV